MASSYWHTNFRNGQVSCAGTLNTFILGKGKPAHTRLIGSWVISAFIINTIVIDSCDNITCIERHCHCCAAGSCHRRLHCRQLPTRQNVPFFLGWPGSAESVEGPLPSLRGNQSPTQCLWHQVRADTRHVEVPNCRRRAPVLACQVSPALSSAKHQNQIMYMQTKRVQYTIVGMFNLPKTRPGRVLSCQVSRSTCLPVYSLAVQITRTHNECSPWSRIQREILWQQPLPQSNAASVSNGKFTDLCACPIHVGYLLSHRCCAAT